MLRVRDRDLDREAALKLLVADGGPEVRARFQREARVTAGLAHPGVVRVYDSGHVAGPRGREVWFILYELVEGRDLERVRAAAGQLEPGRVARIGAEVADALAAAHAAGVLHRDVKPSNIMLRAGDGPAVLCDFGLARRTDAATFRTTEGKILGTLRYLAPEVLRGGEPTPASDQFALALTLWILAAGEPPWSVDDALAYATGKAAFPVPPVSSPAGLEAILARALREDPAMRFADLANLRDALAGAEAVGDAAAKEVPRPVPGTTPGDRSAALPRAGHDFPGGRLALAVLVVGLVLAAATRARGPPPEVVAPPPAPAAPRTPPAPPAWLDEAAVPPHWRRLFEGHLGRVLSIRAELMELHPDPLDNGAPDHVAHAARAHPAARDPAFVRVAIRWIDAVEEFLVARDELHRATPRGEASPYRWRELERVLSQLVLRDLLHPFLDLRWSRTRLQQVLLTAAWGSGYSFTEASRDLDATQQNLLDLEDRIEALVAALPARPAPLHPALLDTARLFHLIRSGSGTLGALAAPAWQAIHEGGTAFERLRGVVLWGEIWISRLREGAEACGDVGPRIPEVQARVVAEAARVPGDAAAPAAAWVLLVESVFRSRCPGDFPALAAGRGGVLRVLESADGRTDPEAVVRAAEVLEREPLESAPDPATLVRPYPPEVLRGLEFLAARARPEVRAAYEARLRRYSAGDTRIGPARGEE